MAGKSTQLALLIAGLFLSIKSYSAGECLAYAGSTVQALEFQGSTCPIVTSQTVGSVLCELVQGGDFVCVEVGSGGSIGGPWRYTGGIFEENDGGQPNPDPSLPPLTPVRPVDWQDPNLNNNGEAVNSNLVKLSQSFKTLSDSLNNTIRDSAANQQNISARVDRVNSDLHAALSFNTNQTAQKIQTLQSSLNSAQFSIENNDDDNYQSLYAQAERHNSVAERAVTDIKLQANLIGQVGWQVDAVMGTVSTMNNVMQEQMQQVFEGQQNSLNAQEQYYSMTAGALIGVQQTLDGLSTGGGSPEDSSTLRSIKYGIEDLNYKSQRLYDATEDVEEAVSGMRSSLSDDLYWTTGQLGEKLDAINSTLSNGSSGGSPSGDTVAHGKLDRIAEGIDGISDSLSAGTGQKSGPSKCTGEGCWKQASWIDSDYPDGVAGIWEERKIAFGGSQMKGYLDSFVPNLQGGSVAPLQLCFNTGLANFGCHDFSIPSYVIAFVRLCILISAGFYCQRLVFGGA